MGIFRMALYHGTNKVAAESILKDGFTVKEHSKHWLGQGIYFFNDEYFARWWTMAQHSSEHGSKNGCKENAIVTAVLDISRNRVLDLRKVDDWSRFAEWYDEYVKVFIENSSETPDFSDKEFKERFRCALFSNIMKYKDIDVIVGCFKRLEHLNSKKIEGILANLDLDFCEVQICVSYNAQSNLLDLQTYDI